MSSPIALILTAALGGFALMSGDLLGVATAMASEGIGGADTPAGGGGSDLEARLRQLFRKYGAAYGVPWRWLEAFAWKESTMGRHQAVARGLANAADPNSVSEDGLSFGVMQVTLKTANALRAGTTFQDLNDPEISVMLAAKLVSQLKRRFPNDRHAIVISYNQGETRTARGQDYTGTYYPKWEGFLADVLKRFPGDEMELS